MNKFANSVVEFLKEEDGPTAVEYAVMLALIVVVCLGTVGTLGSNANDRFDDVSKKLSGATN
jgi:pilus assembly protein Flp/PilA